MARPENDPPPAASLPADVGLVAVLLLALPLASHLLQLLPVLALNEALLMGHLREVICRGGREQREMRE